MLGIFPGCHHWPFPRHPPIHPAPPNQRPSFGPGRSVGSHGIVIAASTHLHINHHKSMLPNILPLHAFVHHKSPKSPKIRSCERTRALSVFALVIAFQSKKKQIAASIRRIEFHRTQCTFGVSSQIHHSRVVSLPCTAQGSVK